MLPLNSTLRSSESPLASLLRDPGLFPQRIEVPSKAVVYRPDDPARNVFYIHSGQVRTYQVAASGSRRLIEILGTDQWCGAAALAGLDRYGEAAEAVTPVSASVISTDRLFTLLGQRPATAIELIRQLAIKLTAYREDASGLVFEDCNRRLLRTLLSLSQSPAASATEDGVVLHITHQQLAQKVGVARETISLALAQLRRKNVLRTGRNQLFFKPEALRQYDPKAGEGGNSDGRPHPVAAVA